MQVKSNHSINNIFDVDNNIEDIEYNNQTYSNGFGIDKLKARNIKKIYYIKKRIKHNTVKIYFLAFSIYFELFEINI